MKRKTAIWKMKQSLARWGLTVEFWQDVKEILKQFEKELLDKKSKS